MSESEILKKINNTPELLSLLYDMDLLPEQTAYYTDRRYYRRTLALGAAWPTPPPPDPLLGLVRELRDALEQAGRSLDNADIPWPWDKSLSVRADAALAEAKEEKHE